MEIQLCPPSRCTGKLPDDLEKDYLIAEEKLDGARYVLYIGVDPYGRHAGNTLLSRRVSVVDSKHVDRTGNVPHITGHEYHDLEGTVIDGEIMGADFTKTSSIMNSSPALAIQKQKEIGKLEYNVFDVMYFRGKNVMGLPLSDRRKILEEVCRRMGNAFIHAIPQIKGDIYDYFQKIVREGGEGVIVKDVRMGYGLFWCKMKKSADVSCIISGFKPGNGKYKDSIGAIALSVYRDGNLIEIGFASGFDDKLRAEMADNPEKYKGMIVDVFAQEVQKTGAPRLRHPTFHRFRNDVNVRDCTLEKVMSDLKNNFKSNRFKGEK